MRVIIAYGKQPAKVREYKNLPQSVVNSLINQISSLQDSVGEVDVKIQVLED